MKLKWKTIKRLNASREGHTWHVRLVGKPEFKYVEELIRFLDTNKRTYRIINHTLTDGAERSWVISGNCINPDYIQVHEPGVIAQGIDWLVNEKTGEIYATRNEDISIMIYKNTLQLLVEYRKEV